MLVQTRSQSECVILMGRNRSFVGAVVVAKAGGPVRIGLAFESSIKIVRSELTGWKDLSADEIAEKPFGTPVPEEGGSD